MTSPHHNHDQFMKIGGGRNHAPDSSIHKSTRVAFTDQKNSYAAGAHLKTTDDLLGINSVGDFSRSLGPSANLPTHFTSNLSNVQNVNSLEISQINLPQINNSRMSKLNHNHGIHTDLQMHNQLKYGPFQKHFIAQNKKAISRMIKQAMLKEDNEPFKGYSEVSNASIHLKKHQQHAKGSERDRSQHHQHNMNNSMIEPSLDSTAIDIHDRSGSAQPGNRTGSKFEGSIKASHGINSKVMETWINETLADAEHLDIPGVILKPEHKNPISRYAIDRLTLTNSGIPNETVDRVYRSLFVYSVGFYELIKKLVSHCQRKYSIITSIWKVFSVLLEYCCQSDYRMLISEITNQHEEEIEKMDRDFQSKCQEFLNNEKILKQNMEVMQKYSEELEKERTNERTLRLKLEEEYMQNSKNHEEEVQLRLKFESKLNSMHSMHRELEIKHKRLQIDLATAQNLIQRHEKLIEEQATDIIHLKVIKAENENKIHLLEEKKATMEREVNLKNNLVAEIEKRMKETQDESDLNKYQIHEQSKELTEQRLKIDCLETKVEGLISEKQHLEIGLKEEQTFRQIFEDKNLELKDKYSDLLNEHNELRQRLVGFEETVKNANERIEQQRDKIIEYKKTCELFEQQNGTMRVELEKLNELYRSTKNDLDEAIDRLHLINRVRHELELRLSSEQESNKQLQTTLQDKMAVIIEKERQVDTLQSALHESEMKCDQLQLQIYGNEKIFEMKEHALNDKVEQLKDIIDGERELREQWIEKFEKEQKDSNDHSASALIAKSRLKDLELELSNLQIKFDQQVKLTDQVQDQLTKTAQLLNEKTVYIDNQKREMHGLKETHTQIAMQKKDYIKKMLLELDAMRDNMQIEINQEAMAKEENYSKLAWLFKENQYLKLDIKNLHEQLEHKDRILFIKDTEIEQVSMAYEESRTKNILQIEKYDSLQESYDDYKLQMTQLLKIKEQIRVEQLEKIAQLEKDKQEQQDMMNGMRVQFDIKTESFKNQINKLIDQQTKLQSDSQSLQDKHQSELMEKMLALQALEQEKDRMLSQTKNKPEPLKPPSQNQTDRSKQQKPEVKLEVTGESVAKIQKADTKDQEVQTLPMATSVTVKQVKGEENTIEDISDMNTVQDLPGSKLVKQATKRRDSMNRRLREQMSHITGYQDQDLNKSLDDQSRNYSQTNLRQSDESQKNSLKVADSRASLFSNNNITIVGQPQPQPEKPTAWQNLQKNIVKTDPYSQMMKNIGPKPQLNKGTRNSNDLSNKNNTAVVNLSNQSLQPALRSMKTKQNLENQNLGEQTPISMDLRRASLESRVPNMESHQDLKNNKIVQEYPQKHSKTQIASEQDLLNVHSGEQSQLNIQQQFSQQQQQNDMQMNDEVQTRNIPTLNNQSHVSLETAQKYHYLQQQQQIEQQQQQQMQNMQINQQSHDNLTSNQLQQNPTMNSNQTLQFSTIGSNKQLPQPLTNEGMMISQGLTENNDNNLINGQQQINRQSNSNSGGGMPAAYMNPQLNSQNQQQQQQNQFQNQQHLQQQQLLQIQQQQMQLQMLQHQQLQQQLQQQQKEQQARQQYKKPDGGASIKGLIRGAATRQQQ
eukprot:403367281